MILPSLLLAALPLHPFAPSEPSPAAQVAVPNASDPVVRVDGHEFTRGDLAQWLLRMRGEAAAREFADAWIYRREAERLGLPDFSEQARAQVEAEIQTRIQLAFGGDEKQWLAEIATARRTPEGRRLERGIALENELRLRALADHGRVVPEEKILRDWEHEYGPGGRRFKVRLLFHRVVMPPMGGLTRAEQLAERERVLDENRKVVNELRDRALAGEPFGRIVRENSEDPNTRGSGGKPEGGYMKTLGWKPSDLDAIAALEPGGISEPIFVQGGFWLVQLEELVQTPLEAVRDEILAKLEAAGPEPDEVNNTRAALVADVPLETLDALHEKAAPGAMLPLDTPVLRIDGVDVSRGEYADYLLRTAGDVNAIRFAEEMHVVKLADEAGVRPTAEEIEAQVEETAQDLINYFHKGDREKWEAETARVRGSLAAWYRDQRHLAELELQLAGLLRKSRVISDDQVRALWRTRYGEDGRSLHFRMIRIDTQLPVLGEGETPEQARKRAEEAIEVARALADDVAQRAKDGEDFAELAKTYSMDADTAPNGGELPFGFDHHTLPQEAVALLDGMKPGEVAGPVESGIQHYVFELIDLREVPFDTVAGEIRAELEAAEPSNLETRSEYNVLTRDLKIEVLPALNRY